MGKNKRQKKVRCIYIYIYLYRGNLSTRVEYRRIKRRGGAFAPSFFFFIPRPLPIVRCSRVARGHPSNSCETYCFPVKAEKGEGSWFIFPPCRSRFNEPRCSVFFSRWMLVDGCVPPRLLFREYGWTWFGEERNWNCLDTGRRVFERGVINSWRLQNI